MARKKKGRKRSYTRRKTTRRRAPSRGRGNRRKPIQRGLAGKVGAVMIGVVPVAIGGTEAVVAAMTVKKKMNLSGFSAAYWGLLRFTNNMANGFIGYTPFDEMSLGDPATGQFKRTPVKSGLPKGSLWGAAGAGFVMLFYDWASSKLAGGRPIKIPMTNYNATGGS